MLSQSLKLLMLILIMAVLLISLYARNRELIDRLPEVQYAKSHARIADSVLLAIELKSLDRVFFERDCQADLSAINEIEPLLLYDISGNMRDEEGLIQMLSQVHCAITTVETETDSIADYINLMYRLANGESIRHSKSVVVDGAKQSIRVYAAYFLTASNWTPITQLESKQFGDDPCETLRDWVENGKTFELRQAAFAGLDIINRREESNDPIAIRLSKIINISDCVEQRDGNEASLIEAAKAGDLDSALQLALLWGRTEVAGSLQARIDHFEQIILANTGSNPYLVHAVVIQLSGLYSAKLREERHPK